MPGKIVGSRTSPSANYVPNLHETLISAALKRMLAQNEYICMFVSLFSEYLMTFTVMAEVKKMGIAEVKSVLQGVLSKSEFESLVFLPGVIMQSEQVENLLKEVEGGFLN